MTFLLLMFRVTFQTKQIVSLAHTAAQSLCGTPNTVSFIIIICHFKSCSAIIVSEQVQYSANV